MNRNNALIKNLGRAAMIVLVSGMAASTTGCKTSDIRVSPTARIQNASDKKIALSVGLMLDDRFCTNRFLTDGGFIFPFGPSLKQQSISLCEQSFQMVTVSTNGVVPVAVDATLTPEMHRCGIAGAPSGKGKLDITLLLQWTLRTGDNRDILWMTTVDGHGNEDRPKVYQLLFDDLANKSYRTFQESPEIKRLLEKKPTAAM
jgi:hypothetical protein